METLRSFIALELSQETQEELAQVQDRLKASGADVKWVNPSGIHLTLKFLGKVSSKLSEEIKKVIEEVSGRQRCFGLKISGLGAFPKVEHPRVIWVGIEQGFEESVKLTQELERHLSALGFLPERRPFKPHLTLGRVRSERNRNQLKKLLQSTNISIKTMRAEKLVLFKSTLTPGGAIYQSLHETRLA